VCCLAVSAGVAILVICFIAISATLLVEIAKLKTALASSATHHTSDASMIMLQNLHQQLDTVATGLIQLLNSQQTYLLALNSSIQMDLIEHSDLLDELRRLHIGQSQASPVFSCASLTD
jgi:hypothetical protein